MSLNQNNSATAPFACVHYVTAATNIIKIVMVIKLNLDITVGEYFNN